MRAFLAIAISTAVIACLLATGASAQDERYCGQSPVNYTFTAANEVAGFVWSNTDHIKFTCGEVSTQHRADALNVGIAIYCRHGPNMDKITMLKQWRDTAMLNGGDFVFDANCHHQNSSISITAFSFGGNYPMTVSYNFNAHTATGVVPKQFSERN